jgi:hypothetical protein
MEDMSALQHETLSLSTVRTETDRTSLSFVMQGDHFGRTHGTEVLTDIGGLNVCVHITFGRGDDFEEVLGEHCVEEETSAPRQ